MKHLWCRSLRAVPLISILFFAVTVPADTISWVKSGVGAWEDPMNWSAARVPSSTDIVDVPGGSSVVVNSTGSVGGGTFWAGVTLTIATGGVLNIYGDITFDGPVTNNGTVNWLNGDLHVNNDSGGYSGAIINESAAVWNVVCDRTINPYYGGPVFYNRGTIRKSAGTGQTSFGMYLDNSGQIVVETGTLRINNGVLAGNCQSASGATLYLSSMSGALNFSGSGDLGVYNCTLTVTSPKTNLDVTGGTIGGLNNVSGIINLTDVTLSGDNLVRSTVNWTRGTLGRSASFTIDTGGVLNLLGDITVNSPFTNNGTVNWQEGNIYVNNDSWGDSGLIFNQSGASWNALCDRSLNPYYGGPVFYNFGAFRKSGGTGQTTFNVYLDNKGQVIAETGTLRLNNGTLAGTCQSATGATLSLNSISGSLDFSGAGGLELYNCNLTITSPKTNLDVTGGTISGLNNISGTINLTDVTVTGDVVVHSTMNWVRGTLARGGSLTIDTSGALNLLGDMTLNGPLTNNGTINWQDGNIYVNNDSWGDTGVIVNQPGASWNALCDRSLNPYYGGPVFYNFGAFRKNGGTGQTTVNIYFDNSGQVLADTGTLRLNSGKLAGTCLAANGASLSLNSISGILDFSGAGGLALYNCNLNVASAKNNLDVVGGTISGLSKIAGVINVTDAWITGDVVLHSTMNFVRGGLSSGSSLTVGNDGVLNLTGNLSFNGGITNQGTVNWVDGDIYVSTDSWGDTGVIVNDSGAAWNINCDRSINQYYGSPMFYNRGTIRKKEGSGQATISMYLDNAGKVLVDAGTLRLNNGKLAGNCQAATGATLSLNSISGSLDFSGSGGLGLNNCNLTITSLKTNLDVVGGTISGLGNIRGVVNLTDAWVTGDVSVHSTMNFVRGGLGSGASLTVATDAVLNVTGNITLNGALTNQGTINWQDGDIYVSNDAWGDTGVIVNETGAIWNARCDRSMNPYYGGPVFYNRGTIRKNAGTGQSTFNMSVDTSGQVVAEIGTLRLNNGKLAGDCQTVDGATLFLNGMSGTVNFAGPGGLMVNSCNIGIGELSNVVGTITLTDSWITANSTLNAPITIVGGGLAGGAGLTISKDGLLNINGNFRINGALTNQSLVNWQDGDIYVSNDTWGDSGVIVNEAGAIWNALCDRSINPYYGGPTFYNAGLVYKTCGTGTTRFGMYFSNTGRVVAWQGTIQFAGGTDAGFTQVNAVPFLTPPNGMVAHWAGDNNFKDMSGAHNGRAEGNVRFDSGVVGQAFAFHGGVDSVVVSDSPSLNPTGSFTIEAWINPSTYDNEPGSSQGRAIVSKIGGAAGNRGYQLALVNGYLWGCFNSPEQGWPGYSITTTNQIPLDTWTHVVWSYNRSEQKLFVNGVQVASSVIGDHPVAATTASLRISRDDNGNVPFKGLIDEVAIYSRALEPIEISAIYSAGSKGVHAAQPMQIVFGQDVSTYPVDGLNDVPRPISLPMTTAAAAAFTNQFPGVSVETFETYLAGSTPSALSFGTNHATLTGNCQVNQVVDPTMTSGGVFEFSGIQGLTSPADSFKIVFDSPQPGFGFYGTDIEVQQLKLRVTSIFGITRELLVPVTVPQGSGGAFFYGMVTPDEPITSIEFVNVGSQGDGFGFDDFMVGIGNVVPVAPAILTQPQGGTNYVGDAFQLAVGVANQSSLLAYQWRKNGVALPRGTNSVLAFTSLQGPDSGSYDVVISNGQLAATSHVAIVVVKTCETQPAGLISHWPGNGSADDLTGNHPGTLLSSASFAPGRIGQAFSFDGSGAGVDAGRWTPGSLWTLSAWVNPSAVPGGRRTIIGGINDCLDWGLTMQDGQFGVVTRQPGGCTVTYRSGVDVVAGNWYFIAATCDGSTACIYVDGQLLASGPVEHNYVGTTAGTRIGGEVCCGGDSFPGLVQDVMVYSRAFSKGEVAAFYAAGNGACAASVPFITEQPADQNLKTVSVSDVTFTVTAFGGDLTYQWYFKNLPIAGATSASLTIPQAGLPQVGGFYVVITNSMGAVTSRVASLTVLPDLSLASVNSPASVQAGQLMNVYWTVTNNGPGIANGAWNLVVSLAADASGNGAVPLGYYRSTNSIGLSASIDQGGQVIVPGSMNGDVWLILTVDSGNELQEVSEANNVSAVPLHIRAPDLRVSRVVAPSAAQFGQTISVTYSVQNAGDAAASSQWTDKLYLSSNPNSVAGATLLGSVSSRLTGLNAGESYTNTATVKMPLNTELQPGSFYIVVVADADGQISEFNENNNLGNAAFSLALPPLPDLMVGGIATTNQAKPGDSISVVWGITNVGPAPITATWIERISLTNDSGASAALGSFPFTNSLASGGGVVRTQAVNIPLTGMAGNARVVIEVDPSASVVEESRANNAAISSSTLSIQQGLSLFLPMTQIAENASNPNIGALLSRNGDISSPLAVTLAIDVTNQLTLPALVTIPAGQASVSFNISVFQNHQVTGNQLVGVTASATGYTGANASLQVLDVDRPNLGIQLASSSMYKGAAMSATVTRDVVTDQSVVVGLASSSVSRLSVPASVTIPAGAASVSFTVQSVNNNFVEGPRAFTITATAGGFNNGTIGLTVIDMHWPELTLTLDSTNISEGDGPGATYGHVRRSYVTDQPLAIALQCSNTAGALVPQGVVIPAGEFEARFPIAAVDDNLVTGPKPAEISGWLVDSITGVRLGNPVTALLTVQDDDGPALKLTISRKVVSEGVTQATSATISRNTPATNDLVVKLTSSDTTGITVPATVTIPIGRSSATFNVTSVDNHVSDGNRNVTITASSDDFATSSDWIVVTDIDLPDLVVENITLPGGAPTESYVTIGYRIANRGLTPSSGPIVQRVLLSNDPFAGGDSQALCITNNGTLAVDGYFDMQVTIGMPELAGDYWVIVEVDPFNQTTENNENNNVRISAAPIHVGAAYEATVQTEAGVQTNTAPVLMTGHAKTFDGQPAAYKPVNIHVAVRGSERIISAVTDAAGNFATQFQPLPGEAGHFYIGATHPGVTAWTTNDEFTILGMKSVPNSTAVLVVEQSVGTGSVTIQNMSDIPLTGLQATVNDASANLSVNPSLSAASLAGNGTVTLSFAITPTDASITRALATIRVTSAEGVSADLLVYVTVQPLRANLVATPASLTAGMVRGRQVMVEFDVVNTGGISSGPVQVVLPQLPWLTVASANPIPALAPGETNHVTLQLTPLPELPLGPYQGSLLLAGDNCSAGVPFTFRALSDAVGSLELAAVDEYTYYAEGGPKVTNATVSLTDAVTGENVLTGRTDSNGVFFVPSLPESYYIIDVQADRHNGYHATMLVLGGQTNNLEAFLPRQTVQYIWTVVPTEIEDRTRITIETTFETVVPIPVVTVDPTTIDLSAVTGPQMQVNVTVSNHGLVAAKDAHLGFPTHPCWEIKPLIEDLGDIPAEGAITVPVIIKRLGTEGCAPCQFTGGVTWSLRCANRVNTYFVPIQVLNAGNNCGGTPIVGSGGTSSGGGGTGGWIGGGGSSGPGGPIINPPNIVQNTNCDCAARVKLQINQEAVMTRDAFKATLQVINGLGSSMSLVKVDVFVRDQSGADVTDLFAIRDPVFSGVNDVTGNGVIAGNSTGQADWIIIPTVDAAPTKAKQYFVGGTLTYQQDGQNVTVPLTPTAITVLPMAQLNVKYFHERDVFADDPFTPQIEPSVPYNLAVMVQNNGAGTASNLRITSAQPQIIENESGLLIDFKIIGTEVAGQNMTPSLTANFGDINPGEIKVGRWLLQSTLQGLFIDYKASFEHLDAIGNKRIALITNVEIHEMIHLVQDARTNADSQPDFLVNDVPDANDRPDTIYLSDGSVEPVNVVESANLSGSLQPGNLQVTLTASMPKGWTYLRVADPGNGHYTLKRVVRSDGIEILINTNAWTTDRTFIGQGLRPIRENILHIFDRDSIGVYTLYYDAPAAADVTAPGSSVSALPASSRTLIPVSWSGSDNSGGSGIAYYDIYVSTDGGPFTPWLRQTTLNSSIYVGAQGSTYAFYSMATDRQGNREPEPSVPDASTTVSISNRPPVISDIMDQPINENSTFTLAVSAADPDMPQDQLYFSLTQNPPGMTIDSSGYISWLTSEATGPSTNPVTVVVHDNFGGSDQKSFNVIVREVNTAPTLTPIANRRTRVGELLVITNIASDIDLPANELTFTLSGAPVGAAIVKTGPSTAEFRWRPTPDQGNKTNTISVIVTDNGSPSLSATQTFNVIVRGVFVDLAVSAGKTNIMVGESNSVPLQVRSTLELVRLSFQVEMPEAQLTNIELIPIGAAEVTSLSQQQIKPGVFALDMTLNPARMTPGLRSLASLGFKAPDQPSVIVPLHVTNVVAQKLDGSWVTNGSASNGRVIVIQRAPVLTIDPGAPGTAIVTVYGVPGMSYDIDSSLRIDIPDWNYLGSLSLTGRFAPMQVPVENPQILFYRAREAANP